MGAAALEVGVLTVALGALTLQGPEELSVQRLGTPKALKKSALHLN